MTTTRIKSGAGTIVAQSTNSYDEPAFPLLTYSSVLNWVDPATTYRGNVTTITSWLNFNGSTLSSFPQGTYIASHTQYDQCGSVRKTWNAKDTSLSNPTQIDYSSTYHRAYPTTQTSADPDGAGPLTSLITSTEFDLSTGLVAATIDANSQRTTFAYSDSLNRLTRTIRASTDVSAKSQTTYVYNDIARTLTTTSDLTAFNDNKVKTVTIFDGLGRLLETQQYESPTSYIATQQQYDQLGRVFKISNPFRPLQGESVLWTTQQFDALGRLISLTTPDNAVASTSYIENAVLITDQTGKQRKSVVDALGRLKQVYEAPNEPTYNYLTTYDYDTLNNLVKVTQGTQLRYFMYDSLKRLIRSRNPEQVTLASLNLSDPLSFNANWSSGFQYDNISNLAQQTDARGVVTTHVYDALNRTISISYSNDPANTPAVTFAYDTAINGKGHLRQSQTANTSRTTIDSYDALGRPLSHQQQFYVNGAWSQSYTTQRAYNLAGGITSQTYPSNRVVNYAYDSAGRVNSFSGNLGDGLTRTYSNEVIYSPFGGVAKEKFGTATPIYNKLFYNNRGQLAEIRESTSYTGPSDTTWDRGAIINSYSSLCAGVCSGVSTPDNNGNLTQQDILIPNVPTRSQFYQYDSLNRLLWAREALSGTDQWRQWFSYDRWGNRTIDTTNPPDDGDNQPRTYGVGINYKQFTVNAANNRFSVPAGQAGILTYDAAGNLTNDTYTGAGNRTYDAENRITSAWGGGNQAQLYAYDATGQRIKRTVDGVETWQIFGFDGELLAEYEAGGAVNSPQKEYGYRNGQLLVTADPGGSGGSGSAQSLTWTNSVGVSISGNNLTRTAAGDGWNSGATSSQSIASGDGYVEFTVGETNKKRSVGLTHNTSVTGFQHIDYGIVLSDTGQISIHESLSVYGVFGTYAAGDILRVAIEGGVVKYRKNGILLRTSTLAPTYPLYAGASLFHNASTVNNAVLHSGGSGSAAQIRWLVSDQLGTPRMVFDGTGSLANMKRHDYLPFGEELIVPAGGRTTAQGYAGGDGVRQQFTSQERDFETGLDYFLARYYSSSQGRFLSVDPDNAQGLATPDDPQGWNGYSYVGNNPLTRVDPDGRLSLVKGGDTWQRFRNWWNYGRPVTDEQLKKEVEKKRGELKAHLRSMDGHDFTPEEFDRMSIRQVLWLYDRFRLGIDAGVGREVPPTLPMPAGGSVHNTPKAPQHVQNTVKQIEQTGRAPQGFRGGRIFQNDGRGGGPTLPKTDAQGGKITYREYDVHPYRPGVNRGAERVVRGSDGSVYYTTDHYKTFTKLK